MDYGFRIFLQLFREDFVTWTDNTISNCFTLNYRNSVQHDTERAGPTYGKIMTWFF